MIKRYSLQEGLRRQARPAAEDMVQMGLREAYMRRNLVQRGLVPPMIGDVGQRLANLVIISVRIGFESGHEGLHRQFMLSPSKLDPSRTPETDGQTRL